MAGIRLEWAQFGDFDSFDVIRSDAPMDINALPSPIASNLPTMYYVDTTVVKGATYYYRVVAWRDAASKVSGEIKASAGDKYWDKVVGLYRYVGGEILDLSPFGGKLIQNNGLNVDNLVSTPTGGPALYLYPNSVAVFETSPLLRGDFTIELYVRVNSTNGGWPRVVGSRDVAIIGSGYYSIQFNDMGDSLEFYSNPLYALSPLGYVLGRFVHYAICRDGNEYRTYVDGIQVRNGTIDINLVDGLFVFGPGSASRIPMWFNEVRLTKGVARYTENFTPPTEPFPSS